MWKNLNEISRPPKSSNVARSLSLTPSSSAIAVLSCLLLFMSNRSLESGGPGSGGGATLRNNYSRWLLFNVYAPRPRTITYPTCCSCPSFNRQHGACGWQMMCGVNSVFIPLERTRAKIQVKAPSSRGKVTSGSMLMMWMMTLLVGVWMVGHRTKLFHSARDTECGMEN